IEVTYGSGHDAAMLSAGRRNQAVEKPLAARAWKSLRDSHFPTASAITGLTYFPLPSCPHSSTRRFSVKHFNLARG
ncbi:MAG TPA: hypothetical protein VFI60_11910, partial [Candidatus Acidoferrum sp.]|nr:hypothetical protein [Candidatus Acidoferrum sp.]